MTAELTQQLQPLEESLWRAETRFDDALMDQTFADDFIEFGRSGRVYNRDQMFFGTSGPRELNAVLPLRNFAARQLSEDIVQVTYISEVEYAGHIERANRSSLWRREGENWRLCFHQGTALKD